MSKIKKMVSSIALGFSIPRARLTLIKLPLIYTANPFWTYFKYYWQIIWMLLNSSTKKRWTHPKLREIPFYLNKNVFIGSNANWCSSKKKRLQKKDN